MIDPRTGYWAKTEDEESGLDSPPDAVKPVRIVPIVRDRKNALLLRLELPEHYEQKTIATIQHALTRGLAVTFQLEEGEVLAEPLPSRDSRRAILAYEATEGGAGVLNRLIEDPHALNLVARRALELMHFDEVESAIDSGDPTLLKERTDEACVRGCYRCLLSYFNQPDHEMIDRTSQEVRTLLVDLARGQMLPSAAPEGSETNCEWSEVFALQGVSEPDAKPLTLAGTSFPFAWRRHFVAAKIGAVPDAARSVGDDRGWILFELPREESGRLPTGLVAALRD